MQLSTRPDPPARYFTPEEANALLPRVRTLMSRATENARRTRERLQAMTSDPDVAVRASLRRELEALREDTLACVDALRDLGVEVKGIEQGLLDFPALRNGEPVWLCWRVSEPRVEWWHPLSAGYAGRQRITHGPGVRWEWRN